MSQNKGKHTPVAYRSKAKKMTVAYSYKAKPDTITASKIDFSAREIYATLNPTSPAAVIA